MSRGYGHTTTLEGVGFAEALDRVKVALKGEGFGVLTDIDVQATMREKLGVEYRPYCILGACNPPLAHRALSADPMIGLLLPCNVIVFEAEGGAITVSAINPMALMRMTDSAELRQVAQEADAKLQRVIAALF